VVLAPAYSLVPKTDVTNSVITTNSTGPSVFVSLNCDIVITEKVSVVK